jgi:hypothetical protein
MEYYTEKVNYIQIDVLDDVLQRVCKRILNVENIMDAMMMTAGEWKKVSVPHTHTHTHTQFPITWAQ